LRLETRNEKGGGGGEGKGPHLSHFRAVLTLSCGSVEEEGKKKKEGDSSPLRCREKKGRKSNTMLPFFSTRAALTAKTASIPQREGKEEKPNRCSTVNGALLHTMPRRSVFAEGKGEKKGRKERGEGYTCRLSFILSSATFQCERKKRKKVGLCSPYHPFFFVSGGRGGGGKGG